MLSITHSYTCDRAECGKVEVVEQGFVWDICHQPIPRPCLPEGWAYIHWPGGQTYLACPRHTVAVHPYKDDDAA